MRTVTGRVVAMAGALLICLGCSSSDDGDQGTGAAGNACGASAGDSSASGKSGSGGSGGASGASGATNLVDQLAVAQCEKAYEALKPKGAECEAIGQRIKDNCLNTDPNIVQNCIMTCSCM